MSKNLKIIFFIVLGVALIFFVSRAFGKKEDDTNTTGIVSEGDSIELGVDPITAGETVASSELSSFSSLLLTLQSVDLDVSLFSNKQFDSLKDNSIDLGDILVGRTNPFIRTGQDTGGVRLSQLNSQALSIETVQPDPKTITKNSAELSAFVEFEGALPVEVVFQYGIAGEEMAITPPVRVSASGFVKIGVTTLQPGKTYTVSSIGTRGSNKQSGSTMTFSTKTQ